MTGFLLRVRGDRLAPEVQDGDVLAVREAVSAAEGALVVAVDGKGEARPERCRAGLEVRGVVTDLYRRVP